MDFYDFKTQCYDLRQVELNTIIDGKRCNSDGVIDPELYFFGKLPKIVWVIKEAYGSCGADQAQEKQNASCINDIWKKGDYEGKPTFLPMIKLANCIANNGLQYDTEQSYKIFKQTTAYVNIKKAPGKSISSKSEIDTSYLIPEYNSLIKRQINLYEPDVVIFGNTFSCVTQESIGKMTIFEEIKKKQKGLESQIVAPTIQVFDDEINLSDCRSLLANDGDCCGDLGIYVGRRRLYFDAYHPSYSLFSDNYIRFIAGEILSYYAK